MRAYPMSHLCLPLFGAFALGGCQSLQSSDNFLGVITPYRLEVVQGNVITKEQAELIRPGMSRAQVRDVLGSPLLADAFHTDRWDYVFSIRRQGTEPQLRRVMVLFDGDKLSKFEGANDLPAEREFVASIDSVKTSRKVPPLAMTDDELKALPAPAKSTAAAPAEAEAAPPSRSYPPLEPRQ
jgi:outer membrane protein assembly factor BamE